MLNETILQPVISERHHVTPGNLMTETDIVYVEHHLKSHRNKRKEKKNRMLAYRKIIPELEEKK